MLVLVDLLAVLDLVGLIDAVAHLVDELAEFAGAHLKQSLLQKVAPFFASTQPKLETVFLYSVHVLQSFPLDLPNENDWHFAFPMHKSRL